MPFRKYTMSKQVLIVDDSKVSRMLIKAMMAAHHPDWVFSEVDTGDKALAHASAHPLDLVTMDVNMPGLNGLDAAEQLKALQPKAFIAMMTANVQSGTRQRADTIGVHFFGKPITEDIIKQILQRFESEHA